MKKSEDPHQQSLEQLLDNPDLAEALESDRFKQFLDHLPIAIAVSELRPTERIIYVNNEFERLSGRANAQLINQAWEVLSGIAATDDTHPALNEAVVEGSEFVGSFRLAADLGSPATIDAWSSVIEDDEGEPTFRLVALVGTKARELEDQIREKDTQLHELQHRVKNNLQMITALIRLEARNVSDDADTQRFDRLAGRVEALALLYQTLTKEVEVAEIDLGTYLSQVASAVMAAHAVGGIRLDLKVDSWLVSINVAMPAGLVVNELMTNALKHAFVGREGGTIKVHSLVDDTGCRVVIADDGIGLPEGTTWPKPGKLSALIARSLTENANAKLDVVSTPGNGTIVTLRFTRAAAEI